MLCHRGLQAASSIIIIIIILDCKWRLVEVCVLCVLVNFGNISIMCEINILRFGINSKEFRFTFTFRVIRYESSIIQ